jgi:hypothetical protein
MVGSVLNHSNAVYMLQIASPQAVLIAAKEMARFCFKKRKELQAAIDYYENKITGTELLATFNELVRSGIRLGKIRPLGHLSKYAEGVAQANVARVLKVAEAWKAKKSRRSKSLSLSRPGRVERNPDGRRKTPPVGALATLH